MKKLFSIFLAIMMVVLCVAVPTVTADAAEEQVLIVTANGKNPVSVPVGSEVLFYVGLYAGSSKIVNCQSNVNYDSNYVSIVPYCIDGELELYSFTNKVYNSSLVMNVENPDVINYNFTKAKGIEVYNNPSMLLFRMRFKAEAPGTTDISHYISFMQNENNDILFKKGVPNDTINPYTVTSVEPALYRSGDADGDLDVTILDAVLIQRAAAGTGDVLNEDAADVSGDDAASLKDVVAIRRFLSGTPTGSVGDCIFSSEISPQQ